MSAEQCGINLLPDSPAEKDEFGTHARCAETIVKLIDSHGDGLTIGLVGSWGSGKSTVVRLLRSIIGARDDAVVLVYDSWAHEGDPLRRSFLELLASEFNGKGWINTTAWQKRLRKLSGVERQKTEVTHPILTAGGWFYLISLLLTPIGGIVLADALRRGSGVFVWGAPISWQAILGAALLLSPFVTAGIELILLFRDSKGARPRWQYVKQHVAERLAPFTKQGTTSSETVTRQDGEPTSIEFEQLYGELTAEGLDAASKQLVIVVDNLDRVGRETALELWGTLQAFLSPRRSGKVRGRISLVIPYDREALRRIWYGAGPGEQRRLTEEEPRAEERMGGRDPRVNARGPRATEAAVAESQIGKAIQVVVEVPRLVLGNWREYLMAALLKVFPQNHDSLEFHKIYQLYDAFLREHDQWATPRDVKLFINELSALHARCGHEFTLLHEAYYVLISRFCGDVAEWLKGNQPSSRQQSLVGAEALEALAAIAFGVPKARAFEVLVGQEVAGLLKKGEGKGLRRLLERSDKVALEVDRALAQVVEDATAGLDDAVTNALCAVHASGVCEVKDDSIGAGLVQKLVHGILHPTVGVTLPDGAPEAFAWLLERADARGDVRAIVARLSKAATDVLSKEGDVNRAKSLRPIVAAVARLRQSGLGFEDLVIEVAGRTDRVFALACAAEEGGDEHLRSVESSQFVETLKAYFVEQAGAGKWSATEAAVLAALLRVMPNVDVSEVERALSVVLSEAGNATPAAVAEALRTSDVLARANRSVEYTRQVSENGQLWAHLPRAVEEDDEDAFSTIVVRLIDVKPTLQYAMPSERASRGRELLMNADPARVHAVARRLVEADIARKVLEMDRDGEARALGVRLTAALVQMKPVPKVLMPKDVVVHWTFLREADGAGVPSFGGVPVSRIADALTGEPWSEAKWPIAETLWSACDQQARRILAAWVREGLSAVEKDEWVSRLRAGNGQVASLVGLTGWIKPELLTTPKLRDALIQLGRENLRGDENVRSLLQRCQAFLNCLNADDAGYVRRTLADAVAAINGEVSDVFIEVFGMDLASEEQPFRSGALVRQTLRALVDARRAHGIRWVEAMAVDPKSPLHSAMPADLGPLTESLEEVAKAHEVGEETRETAGRAARALRLQAKGRASEVR